MFMDYEHKFTEHKYKIYTMYGKFRFTGTP